MSRSIESIKQNREQTKARSRAHVESVADIGTIPAVVNPARRAACLNNLELFLQTYFPASTGLSPFSADHQAAIGRIESCEINGGLFGQAFPRGGAKTTISENAVIHATSYGHRRFPVLFGADANSAAGNIDSIKMEFEENDLLMEDFPEICHAVRALEGKYQRCASQTHIPGNVEGWEPAEDAEPQQTHITWTADTIVLPTIYVPEGWGTVEGPKPDANLVPSPASGTIIATRGLMGGARGLKYKRPDGTQQRPDLIIIDDPQTDESASTPLQVNKRLNVIRKSVLKLGGHGKKLAVVMNATVIKRGDLVEQIFDPKKFPAWQCVRIKMVKHWSDVHDTLWMEDYARLRNTYDRDVLGDQQRAHREATDFYRRNRAKMDAGCETFWEHCYDHVAELSAIQHAYNLLIDDGPDVFASECQNEPEEERKEGEQDAPDAAAIAQKLNRLARGVLPGEASRVTAFVDVHDHVLYWMVCGFGDGFGGGILDYGTWPDQKKAYFGHREVKRTLAKETGKPTFEAQLYDALDKLTNWLMAKEWRREDGTSFKIERMPIDAHDTDHAETVKLFCRRSPHAAILIPSTGIYVGAKSAGFNDRKPQAGERRGWNWRIAMANGARVLRFDTNSWKSRIQSLLAAPMGSRGCLSLFGEKSDAHKMLVDHLTGERGTRVEAKGKAVTEWSAIPGRDVHYLDCLVGCGVAASVLGCDVVASAPGKKKPRRASQKVSYF